MEMVFDAAMAAKAREAGACRKGAESAVGMTVEACARRWPEWALRCFSTDMAVGYPDVLVACARAAPEAALKYAAALLPADVLVECARERRWAALEHAAALLLADVLAKIRNA